eukprot:6109890-Ditylum_brightwellii.AAC.1
MMQQFEFIRIQTVPPLPGNAELTSKGITTVKAPNKAAHNKFAAIDYTHSDDLIDKPSQITWA